MTDTVTQVSILDALLASRFDGCLPCRELLKHGDHGTGTFDRMDGEMIIVDGSVYQVKADGKVYMPDPDSRTFVTAVAIEREHGTWCTDETVRHIKALREHTNVIVRLCSALDSDVGTFVGLGARALIATAVLDADEARRFLGAVEKSNIETYGNYDRTKWAVPVVMMETAGAADDTEEIVAMLKEHQGVCHPGPLDLSASLGAAWGTERYESTLRRIERTAKAEGVPLAGVFNTLEDALDHGLGMVLAPVGMDGGALNTGIVGINPLESLQNNNAA